MLPSEHLIADGFDIGLNNEIEEVLKDRFSDQVFGIVKEESCGWIIDGDVFLGKFREAGRILGK